MSLQSLAPDGRQLNISGVTADSFLTSWLWVLSYQGTHGPHRFSVGVAEGQERTLRVERPASEITKRQATGVGGSLVALEASGRTTMVWHGDHYEISTHVPGTNVPFESFIALLSDIEPSDTQEGLTVQPASGVNATVELVCGINAIHGQAGEAGVQIDPIERLPSLPAGDGEETPGGRLWRVDEHSANGSLRLRAAVVVGSTSVTRLVLKDPESTEVLNFARTVQVSLGSS